MAKTKVKIFTDDYRGMGHRYRKQFLRKVKRWCSRRNVRKVRAMPCASGDQLIIVVAYKKR